MGHIIWPLVAVAYVAGMLIFVRHTYGGAIDGRTLTLAREKPMIAAALAYNMLGTGLIWPLGVAIYLLGSRDPEISFDAKQVSDIAIEGLEEEFGFEEGSVEPRYEIAIAKPPPCAECGSDNDDAKRNSSISRTTFELPEPGDRSPPRMDLEQYALCDDCFDKLTENYDETSKYGPIPPISSLRDTALEEQQ